MAGDFNFTLHDSETWGVQGRKDPMDESLLKIFKSVHLVDLKMNNRRPTWFNGRQGFASMCKKLDRFLVKSHLMTWMVDWEETIGDVMISDHRPISLEWNFEQKKGRVSLRVQPCVVEGT